MRFGDTLRGLVDIVGIADIRSIPDTDDASWNRNFDLNVRHAYLAIQIGARAMAKGGSMVFVSSISGTHSIENEVSYGAAKAALNHLVRGAAHELGPQNIRVNAVTPGFVRTPRLLAALSEDFWTGLKTYIPLRRAAEPSDIAKAILFLASDMSSLRDRRGDSDRRRPLDGRARAAYPVRARDADEGRRAFVILANWQEPRMDISPPVDDDHRPSLRSARRADRAAAHARDHARPSRRVRADPRDARARSPMAIR